MTFGCTKGGRASGALADTQKPAPTPIVEASIEQLQEAQTEGRLSAEALVTFYQDRITHYDQSGPVLNSIQVMNEKALEHARVLDAERAAQGPNAARAATVAASTLAKANKPSGKPPSRAAESAMAFRPSSPGKSLRWS